jgi:hypothetical protein
MTRRSLTRSCLTPDSRPPMKYSPFNLKRGDSEAFQNLTSSFTVVPVV